jgi:small-conductance mechanosensitive channel/CRP-like cAMP-binding protein
MIDLSQHASAAAHDPLVVAWIVFSIGGLVTHFALRRHPLGRALARVALLVGLTIFLLHAGLVPYEPLRRSGVPLRDIADVLLKITWWVGAAWFLVGFVRAFVVGGERPREGKLLQDLLAGLIYLAAVFAIVSYVFDLPIRGLLATSGVIAIVLGLALQSTLSDLFSGVVLNFSRPYRPGDWVSIDGGTDGRVIEINWRATHVLTAKRDLAIVPNSTIAKAKIVNASSPSGIHGMTVTIQLDAATPPAAGAEILQHAILNTLLILATPAPTVAVKSIAADAVAFEIAFFVEELAQARRAQNELFDWISRHLAAAGIALTTAQSQPQPAPPAAPPAKARTRAERALDLAAIFAELSPEERGRLAAEAKRLHHDEGDVLVKPGEVLHSLSIIGEGVVSVTRMMSLGEVELLRLGPGDHFGEIGLLTGAAAEGTLKVLVAATLYELTKEDLAPVLEARPEVSQEMCRALARLQAAGQLIIASPDLDKSAPPRRVAAWFSDRLHRLFDLEPVD